MENKNLKFTIITPSYNEEKDIRKTLEGFVNLTYPDKEILIIDDSTDKTPEIIKEFSSRGVQLIKGPKKGCCEAVNLGIELATGDVVINADADVILPPDFLEKLAEKYNAGADWVLVDSRAPNTNRVFSRFVGTMHIADHIGRNDMYYAEAFSCRRDIAIKLGMFGPSYPARFCRDWLLGKKLTDGGYKKVYDPSIVVLHPQPDNLKEYWAARKARGRFGPLQHYFMFKRSLPFLFCKLIAKDIIFISRFALIIPAVRRVFKIARYSERGLLKDFFPIFYAYFIQESARVVGEWEGFKMVLNYYLNHLSRSGLFCRIISMFKKPLFDNKLSKAVDLSVHAKYHAFRLAEVLDNFGVLNKFYTIYPKFKIISGSDAYDINGKNIKSFFFLGALKYLNGRIGRIFPDNYISSAFDRLVSLNLNRSSRKNWIFHCYSGYCERSLKKARKLKAITVLERACPHIDFQNELLNQEEYFLSGHKKTIKTNEVHERMKREYEMADYIIVPSKYSYNSFIERGFSPSKIIIVPLCNEKLAVPPKSSKIGGKFTVLCVGGNFYRKGILYLLKAWNELNLKNAELIIKGEIPKEFSNFTENKNIKVITSHISNEEIINLYQRASIFVLPSIDDGFGMVVAEAMAAKLPVIITKNVGIADGIRNGKEGFIVPIRDPESLKEKIKIFYDYPQKISEMGEAAFICSKKYTPEEYGKRMISVYENILK